MKCEYEYAFNVDTPVLSIVYCFFYLSRKFTFYFTLAQQSSASSKSEVICGHTELSEKMQDCTVTHGALLR